MWMKWDIAYDTFRQMYFNADMQMLKDMREDIESEIERRLK